jgi:hypothetical protein
MKNGDLATGSREKEQGRQTTRSSGCYLVIHENEWLEIGKAFKR